MIKVKLDKFTISIFTVIFYSIINIVSVDAQTITENIITQNDRSEGDTSSEPRKKELKLPEPPETGTPKEHVNSTPGGTHLKLPEPPQTGTPKGDKTPGGTRPEEKCPQVTIPLTALIANNEKDYTLSPYPSFWFYIPYQPPAIKSLEFALKNAINSTTIYRTAIQLKDSSGLIKISLPQEKQYALTEGINYRWELMLSCQENKTEDVDFRVSGWVQKLAINSELDNQINQLSPLETYQFYLDNEIWHDAINQIASYYFAHDENSEIKETWLNLLDKLEESELSQEILVESILFPSYL